MRVLPAASQWPPAERSVACFGPVAHQHAGEQQVELAAALGFQNVTTAIDIYKTPEYQTVLRVGGMAHGESKVVNRTICAIEVSE